MQEANRYNVSVRGTRAYLAGVGSSGSLLAGAAVLFILASAIVAFRGWPDIGTGPATSNVSAAPVAVTSRDARRLNVVLATTRLHVLATRGGLGTPATRRVSVRGVRSVSSRPSAPGPGSASGGGASGGSRGASGSKTCDSCVDGQQNPLVTLTNTVTRTVSTIGSYVGRQITGVSGAAATPVSAVSPQAGSDVASGGSSAGNGVTDAATSAASVTSTTVDKLAGGGGH